jgi:TPR repeat protein
MESGRKAVAEDCRFQELLATILPRRGILMKRLLRGSKLVTFTVTTTLTLPSRALAVESLETAIAAYREQEFPEALEIFQRYAEKQEPSAQYHLCMLYHEGLGVERDEDEAFLWCKRAADAGILDAQYQLGLMYLQGEGTEEDDALALEWLWQAADRGHQQAKEVLQFTLNNDFTTGC